MLDHRRQTTDDRLAGSLGSSVVDGMNNAEIAEHLVIGERTVKTHLSNILSKLHLEDRTQAAVLALRKRLVPLDD